MVSAPATRAARVLFVTHNIPRHDGDAAGSFVLRLAVALQQQGTQVRVIAPGAPGLPARDHVEGIPITRVRYAADDAMTLAYTGSMAEQVRASWGARFALLGMLRALRRATREALTTARREGAPYDIVHVHWWFPAGLALWKAWRADDPPRVLTMHGSDVRLAARTAPAHPLMRSVLAEYAVRTAVSTWLAEQARDIVGGGEVLVSPMPVNAERFLEQAAPEERRGILFVGRLNVQKGLADLLEAMARPPLRDTVLHIVGDGPDRESLRSRAESLGVASRLVWHHALTQDALIPRYRQARAVVMPSRGEGLGLVAVESQLCGTPVVAYADGGLPDVVNAQHGGTLVAAGDIGALAEAIARVTASDASVHALGDLARQWVLTRFTPQAVADRYAGHYAAARHAVASRHAAAPSSVPSSAP